MTLFYVGCFIGGFMFARYLRKTTTKNNISNSTIKGSFIGGNSQTQKVGNNSYSVQGGNICINGGKIVVDGEVIADDLGNSLVNVTVEGDCTDLTTGNGDVTVYGDIQNNIKTGNGDVDAHKDIRGNVTTGNGDVDCAGKIGGNVSTRMGDIVYRQ